MLNNRVLYFLALILTGFAGYYVSFYSNQQSHKTVKLLTDASLSVKKVDNNLPAKLIVAVESTHQIANEDNDTYFPKYLPNQAVLNNFIDNAAPYQIEQYLNKWIAKEDLDFMQISDKQTFAKSLVREFLGEQDNLRLYTDAHINFSLSNQVDEQNLSSFKLSNSRTPLYAHLQLEGLTAAMNNIFVKWTHNGNVLLFSKKKIDALTEDNWVNWTPEDHWKTGNYEVIFYQFDELLTPIASANYSIY
ncbi:MAG: hypothetical protein FE834_02730 [Gammaproteobacteria bacterium]|nr:hypothetical protein [Gammaproteobacteria bacterium]